MRFVLWIGTESPWDVVREAAVSAEADGWDGVYLADHFMPDTQPPGLEPRLEAWTTVAGLAALTERVRLGVLVSGNTYRHPAVLAKMAATVDRLSGGRLVLGLGAGWQMSEHVAYGIELPEVPERLARLEEACEVVQRLLTGERSDFDGRYYHLEDAPCEPKPLQHRLPLLLGVSGERVSLGIAARFAQIWNCWGTPEAIRHKSEVLERHCARVGTDPPSIERSAQALVLVSDDAERIRQWREREWPAAAIVGTPGEVSEKLEEYRDAGLDEFVVPERTFGSDPGERRERLRHFLDEVAGPFRS